MLHLQQKWLIITIHQIVEIEDTSPLNNLSIMNLMAKLHNLCTNKDSDGYMSINPIYLYVA